MKRFYKDVSVAEEGGAYRVLLDGRTLKTSAKATLEVPTRVLAEAIADEWQAQGEELAPHDMFLTRLAFAAIDGAKADRKRVADHALSFGRTDLLAYRAETPQELVGRQSAAWDPLLEWLFERFGAKLNVTTGIGHVAQPEASLAALQNAIAHLDDYRLATLHAATTVTGSLVIALALLDGRITGDRAFAAGTVDEAFQAEKWGADQEAQLRLQRHAAELSGAERFLALLA